MQRLPACIGQLVNLMAADFSNCDRLQQLPESLGNLRCLKHLNLRGCRQLKQLPDSIGKLGKLIFLKLRACDQLEELPATIGELVSLTYLDLCGCSKLAGLPAAASKLSSLGQLDLQDCSQLQYLPTSLWQLDSLLHVDLLGCNKLVTPKDEQGFLEFLEERTFKSLARWQDVQQCVQHLEDEGLQDEPRYQKVPAQDRCDLGGLHLLYMAQLTVHRFLHRRAEIAQKVTSRHARQQAAGMLLLLSKGRGGLS